jgi:hypothetical protein
MDLLITVCDEVAEKCPRFRTPDSRGTGAFPTPALSQSQRKSASPSSDGYVTVLATSYIRSQDRPFLHSLDARFFLILISK